MRLVRCHGRPLHLLQLRAGCLPPPWRFHLRTSPLPLSPLACPLNDVTPTSFIHSFPSQNTYSSLLSSPSPQHNVTAPAF